MLGDSNPDDPGKPVDPKPNDPKPKPDDPKSSEITSPIMSAQAGTQTQTPAQAPAQDQPTDLDWLIGGQSSEVSRRYRCLEAIFVQRLVFAKETLKYTNTSTLQLSDMRQDLKQIIDEMKCCTLGSLDHCTDFVQCDADAAPIIALLAERIDTQARARDKDKLKLSAVKTPKFSGDVSDYLFFKAEFLDTVASRASDRVALLKLRDEALRRDSIEFKSVSGCSALSDAFYALDSLYGDSELQRNSLLVRLRELPSVTRLTDSAGLRNIVTTLETIIRKIELIQDCDLLDSATFSALMVKLPGRIRRDIDEKIFDRGLRKTAAKFQVLIDICKRHAHVTDSHYYRTKAYGSSNPGVPGTGGAPSLHLAGVTQNTSTCIFHENATRHRTPVCNRMLVLPTSEIIATLQRHGHCLCCFDKHTGEKKCTIRCSEPGCRVPASHSKLLHSAFIKAPPSVGVSCNAQTSVDDTSATASAPPMEPPSASGGISNGESDTPADYDSDCSADSNVMSASITASRQLPISATHFQRFSAELGKDTLRPCHQAFIMGACNRLIPINVFYDLGSDLSQIAYDCVSATALKSTTTLPRLDLHVAGSRKATPFGKSALFTVPIRDATGSVMFTLSCAAVPYIGQLRSVNTTDVFRQFTEAGHDCADALQAASGAIDCLVGCNFPEVHPLPIAQLGSVTLAQNRFGKLVYGSHPTFPPSSFMRSRVVSTQLQSCVLMSEQVGDFQDPFSSSLVQAQVNCEKRDDLFDRLSQIEELPCAHCGRNRHETRDEVRKLEIYRECLEFQPENKRVLARLPWNVDLSSVPDNRPAAEKRLAAITKSLQKDQRLLEAYRLEFGQMIQKGIIVPVTAEQDEQWRSAGGKVWYVAHFPVQNEKSSSTPVRVVFDTSIPYKGVHLSKLWEVPPNLIPDLRKMCVRFRDHSYALSLDFSKAYWTVFLRNIESHMQRLLWNDLVADTEPMVYRMTRNSFGMVPSGAVCSLAMLIVAEHYRESYPHVYDFVSGQIYVDDGVSSCKTLEEVFRLARDISHVMSSGGFTVKHFLFGGTPECMSAVTIESIPDCATLAEQSHRVLGTTWNPTDDTLQVQCRINLSPKKRGKCQGEILCVSNFQQQFPPDLTLRQYVSAFASLFDPLGLVSPVTILLKHELGRLFMLGILWDDNIPHGPVEADNSTYERCRALISLLLQVTAIRFPRCLQANEALPGSRPFLVGFADASQTAYAACVYLIWPCVNCHRSVLVTAKAKPLPKKGQLVTIPRAELLGCLMLARLVHAVQTSTSHDIERAILLTDSTIALAQISSPPIRLKIWPAVRVEEIQALTSASEWFHVQSENNVADLATRGCNPDTIGPGSTWQNGPSFMEQPIETWPIVASDKFAAGRSKALDSIMEVRPAPKMNMSRLASICAAALAIDPLLRLQSKDQDFILRVFQCVAQLRFRPVDPNDSWLKLRRMVSRVIRFLLNLLRQAPKQPVPQGFSTFTRAEQREWLARHDHFSPTVDEMDLAGLVLAKSAQAGLTPKIISSMSKLNPLQDQFGLWRAVGRVHSLPTAPIIIPADSPLALVITRFYHNKSHSGSDTTLAMIRERFWIVKGQVLTNRLVSACVICRKLRKKPVEIEMAPLNPFRYQRSPVFATVFIDLCGPYLCKSDRRNTRANPALAGKVWIMVIVCAASHAVHLELVENYATSGFLSALDNFVTFRAKPIRIIADSGSQIRSAGDTIDSLWLHVQVDELRNHFCDATEWVFVPSGAHEFVGLAERLVRAVKESMQVTSCTTEPKLDRLQFSRLLYAIANNINDRPLAVGRSRISKLDDIRIIRPNDLLFGRSSGEAASIAEFDYDNLPAKRRQFFEILENRRKILNQFWTKFYRIVFHTLLPRSKWLSSGRPVSVGDVVLIRDTNPVRGIWTLGHVQEVTTSSTDGRIREVLIRYKGVLGKKPIDKKQIAKSKVVLKSVRDVVVLLEAQQ